MVIEDLTFQQSVLEWLRNGAVVWGATVVGAALLALFASFLALAFGQGPVRAVQTIAESVRQVARDWGDTSFRRIYALAVLALKESLRRRVLVALAVFCVILLFGSLFLNPGADRPDRMFLEVLFSSSDYLLITLSVVLASFSLPQDRKDRTLYTIVSKPVRPHEILLGRIFGFLAMATLLLTAMGALSYLFVVRGLSHGHELDEDPTKSEYIALPPPTDPEALKGRYPIARAKTNFVHGHRHFVELYSDGTGKTDDGPGHWHEIRSIEQDGKKIFEFGPPKDLLKARVPVYGKLQYFDREGKPVDKGINVGKEWTYRSCIEGRTKCAAVWSFANVDAASFSQGLPLELTLGVFRTWKGDMSRGIVGTIALRNPRTNVESSPKNFLAREFYVQRLFFDRQVETPGGPRDLFKEFVDDGRVDVIVQCKEHAQYFCMARADVYLRRTDASFALNFAKGMYGIWLQVLLAVTVGVTASTFLRGPVALLVCVAFAATGFFRDFVDQLVTGEIPGGGPLEAMFRLTRNMNPVVDLDPGAGKDAMLAGDGALKFMMGAFRALVPDFAQFNDTSFVSNGFDVSPIRLFQHTVTAVAFVLPVVLAGHFCIKFRQVDQQ